jgi:hypothetical protein
MRTHACRVKQYEGKFAALQAISQGLQKENDKLRRELSKVDNPATDAGAKLLHPLDLLLVF